MVNSTQNITYDNSWGSLKESIKKQPIIRATQQYLKKKDDKGKFSEKETKLEKHFNILLTLIGEDKTKQFFQEKKQLFSKPNSNISKIVKSKVIEELKKRTNLTSEELGTIGKNSKNKKGTSNKSGYIDALVSKLKNEDKNFEKSLGDIQKQSNPFGKLLDQNKENKSDDSNLDAYAKATKDLDMQIQLEKARENYEKKQSELKNLQENNKINGFESRMKEESTLLTRMLNMANDLARVTESIAQATKDQYNQAAQQAKKSSAASSSQQPQMQPQIQPQQQQQQQNPGQDAW